MQNSNHSSFDKNLSKKREQKKMLRNLESYPHRGGVGE